MTLLSRALSFFPLLVVGLAVATGVWFVEEPGLLPALATLMVLYGLPLAVFRIHRAVFPHQERTADLVGTGYVPWFGEHCIQQIFIMFPVLEKVLRLVPGLFSLWLRAWGSKIGRSVYWTPIVDVLDRHLLDVGDEVVFGHMAGMSGHVVTPRNGNLSLLVCKITIGARAFIGAGTYLGPGVVIEPGVVVPAASKVMPMRRMQ